MKECKNLTLQINCATTKDRSLIRAAAERCAGFAIVPLVRFANGAEHREARQCVQSNREQNRLTFARTAVLPAQRYVPFCDNVL